MLPAGIGADYKKQETYYASQEYKDDVELALETDNKLPTFETRDRKITSRNRNKKLPPLSYPIATGPSQRTGDRLVIKCLEFEPPGFGAGAKITPTNLFKQDEDGNLSVYSTKDRKDIINGDAVITGLDGKPYTGKEKPGLKFSNLLTPFHLLGTVHQQLLERYIVSFHPNDSSIL